MAHLRTVATIRAINREAAGSRAAPLYQDPRSCRLTRKMSEAAKNGWRGAAMMNTGSSWKRLGRSTRH